MRLPAYKTKIVCTIGPASSSEAVTDKIPVDYKRLPGTVIPGSLIFLNEGEGLCTKRGAIRVCGR